MTFCITQFQFYDYSAISSVFSVTQKSEPFMYVMPFLNKQHEPTWLFSMFMPLISQLQKEILLLFDTSSVEAFVPLVTKNEPALDQ